MQKENETVSLTMAFIQPLILFVAALYLFGFSLNGVNVYGFIDDLIPVERFACLAVSLFCFAWTTYAFIEFGKMVFHKQVLEKLEDMEKQQP